MAIFYYANGDTEVVEDMLTNILTDTEEINDTKTLHVPKRRKRKEESSVLDMLGISKTDIKMINYKIKPFNLLELDDKLALMIDDKTINYFYIESNMDKDVLENRVKDYIKLITRDLNKYRVTIIKSPSNLLGFGSLYDKKVKEFKNYEDALNYFEKEKENLKYDFRRTRILLYGDNEKVEEAENKFVLTAEAGTMSNYTLNIFYSMEIEEIKEPEFKIKITQGK